VTREQLLDWLEQRAEEEEQMGSHAPVCQVLRSLLPKIRGLKLSENGEKPDRMLRADEVADRLGVSVRTVYKSAGCWPFARRYPTGSVRFSEQGLKRWLARQR
jgi:predicted DNA-binding transcriptional regulator AlpA